VLYLIMTNPFIPERLSPRQALSSRVKSTEADVKS
jgi:hypothetical protein